MGGGGEQSGGPICAVSQIVTLFLGLVNEDVQEGTVGGITGFRVWLSLRMVVNPDSE